ncbi:PEP-CTERM sorting domain-containing protein [Niveibacterium sp.]|uniref:PEP-CTERM sorting domain-containing protein n=1 Tax=Niveibacterium sp. TaxID=2017444 RepID=UPI0035B4152A
MHKKIAVGLLALSAGAAGTAAAAPISSLIGTTTTPQVQMGPEWFSRFDASLITTSQFNALKTSPAAPLGLFATSEKVRVTYVGTGAARDSNLFLASDGGAFDTTAFWNPIYASGGTNNLSIYNPVNSSNELFQTRAGCSYQTAKAGNTCLATQIGMSRDITGLTVGSQLVFGLQTQRLVYDGINLPNVEYFFTGPGSTNDDPRGWNDDAIHARAFALDIGDDRLLVGFEDTWLGAGTRSDRDFNDMVFIFEGVAVEHPNPVPAPSTAALLALGLGLMGWRTRAQLRR